MNQNKFFANFTKKSFTKKAFTLIELMVVIAIVVLLASIVFVALGEAQAKARDGERKAEVDAIRKALAFYYIQHGQYPESSDWLLIEDDGNNASFVQALEEYLPEMPEDPLWESFKDDDPEKPFSYQYSTGETGGENYMLYVEMESDAFAQYTVSSPSGDGGIAYGGESPPPVVTFAKRFNDSQPAYPGEASFVYQTIDSGYIMGGWNNWAMAAGGTGMFLFKLDQDGNQEWGKKIITPGINNYEEYHEFAATSDGGLISVARTVDSLIVIKLNSAFNIEWGKLFSYSINQQASAVRQTLDGGYIIGGSITEGGKTHIFLLKLDQDGNQVWRKVFVKNWANANYFYSVQQTSDGNYIAVGRGEGTGGLVFKIDPNGELIWAREIGDSTAVKLYSVEKVSDGYVMTGGYWIDIDRYEDILVVKLDFDGNLIWKKTYGWESLYDIGNHIKQTHDGGLIVVGGTNSTPSGTYNILALKLNSTGEVEWGKVFGGGDGDFSSYVHQTSDGGYVISGKTEGFGAEPIFGTPLLIKIDNNGDIGNCSFSLEATPLASAVSPLVSSFTASSTDIFFSTSTPSLADLPYTFITSTICPE